MVDEHDHKMLPIANVSRIMKQILPPSAKISKEAKETMQECVSEFISFVTGEASGKCHKENRKTLNGEDICWALASLGFDDYSNAIAMYSNKLRNSTAPSNVIKEENVDEAAAESSKSSQIRLQSK